MLWCVLADSRYIPAYRARWRRGSSESSAVEKKDGEDKGEDEDEEEAKDDDGELHPSLSQHGTIITSNSACPEALRIGL